ncbi:hypothetical protein JH06_1692 [Blastocystis sp. subtype 4]|uniref:hypothetical protein n=1 Tax=Blastocystis sp. subtype 4 TaxID=944170 RepID=UPI0007119912|nr:hypothetical protein JH06_1692 [Blastocystis sp. subtype 4]KNB44779.1 hypothetical protein JH06_1692 [Blastocystis sp. subtype 4]|eukprot:XP_014528202.1 hypothetical protein JH06_1692 [Blastocystis sp. subtype 4]
MPKALVAISEGSEELEAIGIIDILRRGKVHVTVASIDESKKVKCARGCSLSDTFDAIVLPGGMPGAVYLFFSIDLQEHLRDCHTLVSMLGKQKEAGRIYAAICASPAVVFATHDLLDGYATCYPSFKDQIEHFKNEKVVVSDNCSSYSD